MWREFRDFLLRGNVVELAVAVVVGAAFGGLVQSFTASILTPLLGFVGMPDFSSLVVTMPNGALMYVGTFLNVLISFVLIMAAVFFFVIKPMNALEARRHKLSEVAATTKICPFCATDIPQAATRCPNCTSEL